MSNEFPSELRQFISQNIESLAQMEVLLLLHSSPERIWTSDDIAKALYIAPEMSAVLLGDLVRKGFAVPAEGSFRFAGGAAQQLLDLLARTYQERRVAVVSEIYSKPQTKVQTFADSFRLRKED